MWDIGLSHKPGPVVVTAERGQSEANKWNKRQEDIPLRLSVKQPALILHKYLSERRKLCFCLPTHPRGWVSVIREPFEPQVIQSPAWTRNSPMSGWSSGGRGVTGAGTRGQGRPGSRGCHGPSVTSTSCRAPPRASRVESTRG